MRHGDIIHNVTQSEFNGLTQLFTHVYNTDKELTGKGYTNMRWGMDTYVTVSDEFDLGWEYRDYKVSEFRHMINKEREQAVKMARARYAKSHKTVKAGIARRVSRQREQT